MAREFFRKHPGVPGTKPTFDEAASLILRYLHTSSGVATTQGDGFSELVRSSSYFDDNFVISGRDVFKFDDAIDMSLVDDVATRESLKYHMVQICFANKMVFSIRPGEEEVFRDRKKWEEGLNHIYNRARMMNSVAIR
jgi:hypothetical protein